MKFILFIVGFGLLILGCTLGAVSVLTRQRPEPVRTIWVVDINDPHACANHSVTCDSLLGPSVSSARCFSMPRNSRR